MDIIYFSLDPWYSVTERVHHVASQLANHNRILFVNPVSRSILGFLRNHLVGDRTRNFYPKVISPQKNLYVFCGPPLFDFSRYYPFINWINHQITFRILKKHLNQLQFKNPVLWVTSPLHFEAVGKFKEILTVYDCMDNHEGFSHPSLFKIRFERVLEERLIAKSDVIFCTSNNLKARIEKSHNNVHLNQNAVKRSFIENIKYLSPPSDFPNSRGPVIGLVGTIYDWVDVDILAKMAEAHPEWEILVIGPIYVNRSFAEGHLNLHLLGQKQHNLLPQYISRFNVGLIPFKINALTLDVNPVKLYEYFAFGIPVVSTAIPEVIQYNDLCYIAENSEDFIKKVELALTEKNNPNLSQLSVRRMKIADENTWEKRVDVIQKILEKSMHKIIQY